MKKFILLIQFSLCMVPGFSQTSTITLDFTGRDAQTQTMLALQSVFIRDITLGCDTTIFGANPSIILINSLGFNENNLQGAETFTLMPITPNPCTGSTYVYIQMKKKEKLNLAIIDQQGKRIADLSSQFPAGLHKFEITSSLSGILILKVSDGNNAKSIKLISIAHGSGICGIRYSGPGDQNPTDMYKSQATSRFVYHLGDSLLFKASSGGYIDDTITAAPVVSSSYTFEMAPVLTDGYYVTGPATAFSSLHPNAMMKTALNSVTQTERISLLELYIPLKAGPDGFNIVQVAGSTRKTYGPGADFTFAVPTFYEPHEVFYKRGALAETTDKFIVPSDGMYHVVIDYAISRVMILQVRWGIIGTATNWGWSTSADLEESAFNANSMSWEISNMAFRSGIWKLRYSNGWIAQLDTVTDIGGGYKGVGVNTNFGGSADALISGGPFIYSSDPGLYSFNLNYTLGSVYNASMTKTGSLPVTDWSAVKCDGVGPGISSVNAGATIDTSAWHWGNQLLADFGGTPVKTTNTNYTWTWSNIMLEADQGFKVRSLNGVIPPSGGFCFDAGYSDLNIAASAPEIGNAVGDDIITTVTGTYTIALNIDAANDDKKELIILLNSETDRYYVKGAATAYPNINGHAMMKVTRNEVNQTNRASLLELYIPVKAGADGFNIVQVSDTTQKTLGPGSGFGVVIAGSPDEPKVPFQRGPYAETATRFTVPADGMYHVVIDYEVGKVVIVPVHWGMIGSATTPGWSISTDMTESAFNLTAMSWNINNLELRAGEWKFRYSNGWKVEIDTTDINPQNWVKVNANFGNAVNALVPGGANIPNNDPGYYTCNLSYVPGSGYIANLTKTGTLPFTNWTGVVSDAVGGGISSDNLTATPDTSAWNWGNQMLADNGGIPVAGTDIYTWTWTNIILEAYQGFKVRSVNGLPPPVGGAYFDAGYAALNVGASAPEIMNDGGNLMAVVKGSYTITLIINAANNDSKEIIIVKN